MIIFVLFAVPLTYETQADDIPSISEFTNCVSFFSRRVTAREGSCRWWEFEVVIEGGAQGPPGPPGPAADPSMTCPCFDDSILRVGFTVFNPDLDPATDLVCARVSSGLGPFNYTLQLVSDVYVTLTDSQGTPTGFCAFNPLLSGEGDITVITNEQFDVCEGLILNWLIDLGKDPVVDCET